MRFFHFFKVKDENGVKSRRLILLLAIVTGIIGVVSMYLTTMMGVLPMIPAMYLAIIIAGFLNGAVAGYLTVVIWSKYLSHYFL